MNKITIARPYAKAIFELAKNLDDKALMNYDWIENFLKVLTVNKRLELLPEIMELYEGYYLEAHQQLKANYYSATPLNVSEKTAAQKKLEKFFKKNMAMNFHVDKKLLGGYKVQVGSDVIDASVSGYLERLQGVLCE